MMGAVRSWLLAVVSVSLLCAVADALMPAGAVRRVGRLVCGLVLVGAVVSPLARLDVEGGQRWLDSWLAFQHSREAELKEMVDNHMKAVIEGECAAYIVDKAAEFGWTCTARVECGDAGGGLFLPVRAEVAGPLPEEARARLDQIIEADLGIPEDRITMDKGEEA